MASNPIMLADIATYFDRFEFDDFDEFMTLIDEMDSAYLKASYDRSKRDLDKKPTKK